MFTILIGHVFFVLGNYMALQKYVHVPKFWYKFLYQYYPVFVVVIAM